MCGIAGIIASRSVPPPSEDELQRMVERLHHRGPDGARIRIDGLVGLAHARLSIIDLQGGWQPIHNGDRSVWMIVNGEIFNHVELRAGLERQGHVFYTRSDTEVIVHLYDRYGDAFVEHLNGQFAIALHDTRRRRVVFARDRTGIRPLYYSRDGQRLAFASEIKALFTLPGIRRALDTLALGEIFTFWSTLPPRTAFEQVRQLPPGHVMAIDLDDPALDTVTSRYWDWQFPEEEDHSRSEGDCAEELHALLVDAVRLQLRADVPVGAYLSGGLDSAVISALVKHHTQTPLRTFSLGFADAEFDERPHQSVMVRHLRTHHSELLVQRGDIAAAFADTVWHAESPIVRTAPTPLKLLAGHVQASGYKVALTGEGADEVFAGYDLFKEAKVRRFIALQPDSRWRARIVERLYPYLQHSPAQARGFGARFFAEGREDLAEPWFAHGPRMRSTQRIWRFLRADVRQQLAEWQAGPALAAQLPRCIDRLPPLARDQYVEATTLLPGYLLSSQGDRMSMAHSVEGRYPFLDHRVVEFANRLPSRFKLRGLCEKYILKRAMACELPASILDRHKQPFRSPDSACFFHDGLPLPWVAELMSPASVAASGLFDPAATGHLLDKCRSGRAIGFPDNMAFVGIVSTLLLHRQFVQSGA